MLTDFLNSPFYHSYSWEQGTAQSALLEFEHGRWSVFNGEKNGPPFRPGSIDTSQIDSHPPWSVVSLAYRSSNTQDGLGRLVDSLIESFFDDRVDLLDFVWVLT